MILGDVIYSDNTMFSQIHEYSPLLSSSINLAKPSYIPLQRKGQRKPETKAQLGGPHRVFRTSLAKPSYLPAPTIVPSPQPPIFSGLCDTRSLPFIGGEERGHFNLPLKVR